MKKKYTKNEADLPRVNTPEDRELEDLMWREDYHYLNMVAVLHSRLQELIKPIDGFVRWIRLFDLRFLGYRDDGRKIQVSQNMWLLEMTDESTGTPASFCFFHSERTGMGTVINRSYEEVIPKRIDGK